MFFDTLHVKLRMLTMISLFDTRSKRGVTGREKLRQKTNIVFFVRNRELLIKSRK